MENRAHSPHALRRAAGPKLSFIKTALLATSTLSGLMLGLAIPNLVSGDGFMVAIKSILLATGGLAVSYVVNRLAVERGAPLATVGYRAAGIVSAASIAFVGLGLFSATYAGIAYNDVDQLRIEAHGEALSDYVSESATAATQAARIVPAMNAIVADLEQKHACELAESCVSGRGNGGNGPVARLLLDKAGRAQTLAQQVGMAGAAQGEIVAAITRLVGEYQAVAGSADLGAKDKRRQLSSLDLKIRQAAARLTEAMPVSLLRAYAEELKAGAMIEGRPDVSATVSGILGRHGQALAELAGTIPQATAEAPAFPKATGVSDTFNYIGHFLPVAAIAAVVELVFPICLWLYTFFALSWATERVAPRGPRPPDPDDETFRRLLDHPALRDEDSGPDDPRVKRGRQSASNEDDPFAGVRRTPRN